MKANALLNITRKPRIGFAHMPRYMYLKDPGNGQKKTYSIEPFDLAIRQ